MNNENTKAAVWLITRIFEGSLVYYTSNSSLYSGSFKWSKDPHKAHQFDTREEAELHAKMHSITDFYVIDGMQKGPDEEDGPWTEGRAERSGLVDQTAQVDTTPHCAGHASFEYDCIDCSDAGERMRRATADPLQENDTPLQSRRAFVRSWRLEFFGGGHDLIANRNTVRRFISIIDDLTAKARAVPNDDELAAVKNASRYAEFRQLACSATWEEKESSGNVFASKLDGMEHPTHEEFDAAFDAAVSSIARKEKVAPSLDASIENDSEPKSKFPMTYTQVYQWIDACNSESARQVLRDYLRLRQIDLNNRKPRKDTLMLDWLALHPRGAQIVIDGKTQDCIFWGISSAPNNTLREAIIAAMDAGKSS